MARNTFGGSASDVAEDVTGARIPGGIGSAWDGPGTGASAVSDLTDTNGLPISHLSSDAQGMVPPFLGPDGVEVIWVDFGGGRVALTPTNVGTRLAAHLADRSSDPHGDRAAAVSTVMALMGAPSGIATLGTNSVIPDAQLPGPREWANVRAKPYGAKGDGVTDDMAAIQAAVDDVSSRGGGTVYFPAGYVYGITDYLYVPSNITLYAYNATIKAIGTHGLVRFYRSSDSFTAYNGHSNIAVLGGTWDANAKSAGVGTVLGLVDAFTLGHNDGITFRDAKITNVSSAHAIDITASRNVSILNCRFEGFVDNTGDSSRGFSEAIQLDYAISGSGAIPANDGTGCQNILVQGCYFGPSARLGAFGRAVGSHTSYNATTWAENVQVLGNRIAATLQEGVRVYGWRNSVIAENVISGSGLPCIIVTGPDPASVGYSLISQKIDIHDNEITGPTGSSSPIRVIGFATARPTGVKIHSNTVSGSTSTSIYVSQATSPSIQNNMTLGSGSSGVYVISCTNPHVTGNHCISSVGSSIGIDTCTGGHVASNFVEGGSSHGLFVSGCTDVSLSGNRVAGCTGSGIRVTTSSARTRVMGNFILRGGVMALGLDITASAANTVVLGNELSSGSWPTNTAISNTSTTTVFDYAGGLTAPGANLVS